jgi:predicted transcriptional regulator
MTSGIHRIYKTESVKFTALPNWVVRDPNYSANTFRFLAYLLSHEDGYEVTYEQIERETGLGRWAINQASQMLSQFGWIEVSRPVADNGRFAPKSWIIKDPTSVGHSIVEQPTDLKKTKILRKQTI